MIPISFDEQKGIQLAILKEIVSFCEKNNLRYFLAYGTAIGAIRHKGYIPWDDDIDICMPRPDYEFLLNNFEGESPYFRVISINNCSNYGLPFGKVHDIRTKMEEHKYEESHFGVYVDLFPLDGVAHNFQITICWFLRKLLNCKKTVKGKGRGFWKDLCMSIVKILLFPFSTHIIILALNKIAKIKKFDESEMVESFFSSTTKKEKYSRTIFEKWILHPFEGNMYRIPSDFDSYLRQQYGDYMQLPPMEKRISHHDSCAYWL